MDSIPRHMEVVHIFTFCFTEILLNIIPSARFLSWDVSTFEHREITFVETSRSVYPLTQRLVQEKRNLELQICENRRTHIPQGILCEICECAYNLCSKLISPDYSNVCCCYREGCEGTRQQLMECLSAFIASGLNVLSVYSQFPFQITQSYSAVTYQLRHRTFLLEELMANSRSPPLGPV